MLDLGTLTAGFNSLGITRGDLLLVHSSYKALGGVEGGPQTVVDALIDLLGECGTLVVPTFNFDFCKGQTFDARNTPSQMGILTELVRKNPKSRRVVHPIYSFSVIGKLADYFGNLRYRSCYGADSVFAKLREFNGKIVVIGLSYNNSMTFFHHVEEMEGCSYRYFKEFKGLVIDEKGDKREETAVMLARKIEEGIITAVDPMGVLLEENGIVRVGKIGGADVKVMSAREVYNFTSQAMKKNPFLLYRINRREVAQ